VIPQTSLPFSQAFSPAGSTQGPYDVLYASQPDYILWGDRPSRLVRDLITSGQSGRALDVGCGDGVNSLALERAGFDVVGVDISGLALRGLQNRFAKSGTPCRGRYLNADVCRASELDNERPFDVVVSCGLFHCLPKSARVEVHRRICEKVRLGGLVLFSSITDEIPFPQHHGTQQFDLPDAGELELLFQGWTIRSTQLGVISDSHRPLVDDHEHAVRWAVVERR